MGIEFWGILTDVFDSSYYYHTLNINQNELALRWIDAEEYASTGKINFGEVVGDEKLKVAALFFGGVGSVYSIYLSQQSGLEVVYLITAHARESRMYHLFPLKVAEISAKALKIPLVAFFVPREDEVLPPSEILLLHWKWGGCAAVLCPQIISEIE